MRRSNFLDQIRSNFSGHLDSVGCPLDARACYLKWELALLKCWVAIKLLNSIVSEINSILLKLWCLFKSIAFEHINARTTVYLFQYT